VKEYMVNYRGYITLWAEDEKEIEKIFQRRFRRSRLGGEIEHLDISLYFDPEDRERERIWQEDGKKNS
jgi:hypothetical protein